MNAGLFVQCVDVPEEAREKVGTYSLLARFVEIKTRP